MSAPGILDLWRLLQAALCDPGLTPAAKVVMGRLLFHLNGKTGQCDPSFETLARGTGMARRTAVRAVRELREAGWVAAGRGGSGSYLFAFDRAGDTPELGTKPSPGGDEPVPTARDGTVPRLGTKRCSELGTKPSPKHTKREHTKGTNGLSLNDPSFDRFWQAYPRRVAKDAAKAAFGRIMSSGKADIETLIAGAERYAAERSADDPKFTKHAATWLNGGCWADEPAPPRRTPGNGRGGFSALDDYMEGLPDEP